MAHYDKSSDSKMSSDYSKDTKGYKQNMGDYSPNVGENQTHFEGNSEGGRSSNIVDSAGVESGLAHLDATEVKNAEYVCDNQRPKGRTGSYGEFQIGT